MIASGYSLDLYCDGEGCKAGEYGLHPKCDQFHDESKRKAWRMAHRRGWRFRRGDAFCSSCVAAGKVTGGAR